MKRFIVTGTNTEMLSEATIEAESAEEAKEEYYELWCQGRLYCSNSDFEVTECKEKKP